MIFIVTKICCRWSGCGDKKNEEDFFPEDKQFLITERVPCSRRVNDLETSANQVNEVVIDDDWTEVQNNDADAAAGVVDIDMAEDKEEEKKEDDDTDSEIDIDEQMNSMNAAASGGQS